MATVDTTINSVQVTFNSGVNNDVKDKMVEGLKHCIKKDVAAGQTLLSINISSMKDSHEGKVSNHNIGTAVDINQINGTRIAIGYPQNGEVTAIVKAIQETFETYSDRHENFGPYLKKKDGNDHSISGHGDHIHLNVNP